MRAEKGLKEVIPELETSVETAVDKAADLRKFIDRAKQVTRLTELTPEIVHEFIEKIVVSKPVTRNGKRRQRVDIYYNTIGLWSVPESKELERAYMSHYETMKKEQRKSA